MNSSSLNRGPKVGAKVRPPDSAGSGLLNRQRKRRACWLLPGKAGVKAGIATPAQPAEQFRNGEGEQRADIHARKCMFVANRVQGLKGYSPPEHTNYLECMDTWLQRGVFKAKLAEYQQTTQKTQAQVCVDLGLTLHSLRQILYQKSRKPSLETMQRAPQVFGCSVTEFMDDPGGAGVDVGQNLTEKGRFFARLVLGSLSAEDLTDEDREHLYQAHEQAKAQLRALKVRLKKD